MTEQEKLYEVLGELLYAVAMSDGVIQKEEKQAMTKLLEGHSWAEQINWSFNYENSKGFDVNQVYKKAIDYCQSFGPSPLYEEFIEAMKIIAESSKGIDKKEEEIISSFSEDLTSKFRQELGLD